MCSPQRPPITGIIPGGSIFWASRVFHHLRDTSRHRWWYLPLVWLLPHKHLTHTQTHIYMATHGHAAARTATLIFNGFIYFPIRPLPRRPVNMSALWRIAAVCSEFMRRLWPEKSDKSGLIHGGAHEWSRHTLPEKKWSHYRIPIISARHKYNIWCDSAWCLLGAWKASTPTYFRF